MTTGRRCPRVLAPVTVVDDEDVDAEPMVARDIGLKGAFVAGSPSYPLGARVSLRVEAAGIAVAVDAEVVRVAPDGVGLAFCEPTEDLAAMLRELLTRLFSQGAALDEKRRAPRLRVGEVVVWSDEDGDHRDSLADLSLTGARVITEARPQVGREILLYLPCAEAAVSGQVEKVSSCLATVVRHLDDGIGVRFPSSGEGFREAISAIRRRALDS